MTNTNNKVGKLNSSTPNTTGYVDLDAMTRLAQNIASIDSPFAAPFIKTDDEGNKSVDQNAIVGAMVLGHEMGISPMASLALGKKLNANSYFSVLRGRELGIDAVTSISKIYNIDTKNGSVIALAVDIIIGKLLDSGTTFEYLRDNAPTPMYKSMNGDFLGHKHLLFKDGKLLDDFYLYIKGTTSKDDLELATKEGKTIIYQTGLTRVTSVVFNRPLKGIKDFVVHYSLQEAIDAGLYNGFHSSAVGNDGKPLYVAGKANWNNHPATHLRHRPLSIGGRVIAADVLKGNYSTEEVVDFVEKPETIDISYVDDNNDN